MGPAVNPTEPSASAGRPAIFKSVDGLFTLADVLCIGLDILIFWVLHQLSLAFNLSQICSFLLAAGVTTLLKYKQSKRQTHTLEGRRWIGAAALSAIAALFLRAGLLAVLILRFSWPPFVAILLPALLSGSVNAAAWRHVVIPKALGRLYHVAEQRVLMQGLIGYVLLLKLFYIGLLELLHEEGYYWNYGQHLDIGYLDHPPLVGWISYACTSLFGHTEFAVRLGPFLLWFLGAYYVFRLTRSIFNRETALCALMLFAVLPYYFGSSFVLLPDASLVACWAAALYYFYRILAHADLRAFIGIGVFIGLGMLSKYSIALLGLAALVFVILDPPSRKLLKNPGLWGAIAIAAFLFVPVIVWNADHDWASFLFQSTRRAGGSFDFDLPDLIGATLVLITPTGLMAVLSIARARGLPGLAAEPDETGDATRKSIRLLLYLTAVPLLVFVLFSLFRNTKLIWVGPLWLGLLPIMGAMMAPGMVRYRKRFPVFGPRPWTITALALIILYGAGLHYLTLGFPGVPFPQKMLGKGWPDIACQVEAVVKDIEHRTGRRPLVVGMDKDRINSWLAFYRGKCGPQAKGGKRSGSGAFETSGRHIFDKSSGMYFFWFPEEIHLGKTLVLVGRKPKDLIGPGIEGRIKTGGKYGSLRLKSIEDPFVKTTIAWWKAIIPPRLIHISFVLNCAKKRVCQ
jgi:dolichol-phosphate mannosyltransferase